MSATLETVLTPADVPGDDPSRWMLDMSYFTLAQYYLTDDEALAFADWLDLITGGGSDTSARIREVVGIRHDAMQHDDCKACGTSWGGGS